MSDHTPGGIKSGATKRVVVVGGVAGGMSAATRLRRLDADASIVVIERSGHVSYANCGLPYYAGGVITEREDLLLQTPERLHDRFRLDVRVQSEVVGIDRDGRTVTVRDLRTGSEYAEAYDALVLSTGASPFVPPLDGVERAVTLRTVEDVDRITASLGDTGTAVIAGGGFIGVELAENLRHRGIDVTLVELADQVLPPLDPELAVLLSDELVGHGVDVRLGTAVSAIGARDVTLSDGDVVPADLVVLAIGVRPDTRLAREAGLQIGPRGGIAVDEHLRTSDPAIFAVGDATEKIDVLSGESTLVPLANLANRQGRRVADVIAGRDGTFGPAQGTAIVKVFSLTAATTGANEKRLVAAGWRYRAIHTHPGSHAGYYPGADQMSIKLLVDLDTDRILGAQAVGRDGVDKRIDVIATAIASGTTASRLAELELAYAPPFGSAKDPINMLGYIAENLRDGVTHTLQWTEITPERDDDHLLVDVRSRGEHRRGAIPGAVNLPLDDLRERLHELGDTDGRHVVVYCEVGQRAHTAATLLSGLGVEVSSLDGGWKTWSAGHRSRAVAQAREPVTTSRRPG